MIVTSNIGLTAPVGIQDVYSTSVNSQNLYLLDYHDHSPGRGVRLTGASIVPGSLSGFNLANGSITYQQISGYALSANYSGSSTVPSGTNPVIYNNLAYVAGLAVSGDINLSSGVWTCPVAGVYHFSGSFGLAGSPSSTRVSISLYKNGTEVKRGADQEALTAFPIPAVNADLQCAYGDTIQLYINASASGYSSASQAPQTFLDIHRVA